MFQQGQSGNPSGRPKGSTNKSTTAIREKFQTFIESNLETLQDDFNTLSPKERFDTLIKLSEFVIPKLNRTTFTDERPTEIHTITWGEAEPPKYDE